MKVDGKIVFCIEPGIITSSGGGTVKENDIMDLSIEIDTLDSAISTYDEALSSLKKL